MNLDYTSSIGYQSLDVAITAFVTLAWMLQLAVLRAPELVESNLAQIGRRILFGGFLIMSCRFIYVLFKVGDLPVPPVTGIGIFFVSLASCVICLCKLFPNVNEVDVEDTERTIRIYLNEVRRMRTFVRHRKHKDQRKEDQSK